MAEKLEWKIVDNSSEVLNATEAQITKALESIGLLAEGHAKVICPVDTGRLRNSLTHQTNSGEKKVYIGTNVDYASYVEFGTSRMRAQPYLKPAVQDHLDEYKQAIKDALSS